MSDLSNLFQGGAGATGSYFAGQNHGMELQQQEATLQQMLQKNKQDLVMNPLDAQMKQAQIAQSQAQLPGIVGQSQSAAAKGEEDQATKAQAIAQKLSTMTTQMGEDGIKQMAQQGERGLQVAAALKKLPVAAHKQAFAQAMQAAGVNMQSPMMQGVMSAPDNEFLSTVESVSKGMQLASTSYVQKQELADRENASQERVNKANNTAKTDSAAIAAEARVQAAELRAKAMETKMKIDERIGELIAKGAARTPEEETQLQQLKEHSYKLKALAAPAVAPNVMGQDNPLEAAVKASQPSNPTPAKPSAPAPSAAGNDFAKIAKQQGMEYEPTKYNYRVYNGKLQRSAK